MIVTNRLLLISLLEETRVRYQEQQRHDYAVLKELTPDEAASATAARIRAACVLRASTIRVLIDGLEEQRAIVRRELASIDQD